MCSITGRLATGTIGFGTSYVSGRSRVPRPAAMTMARIGQRIAERGRSFGGLISVPGVARSSSLVPGGQVLRLRVSEGVDAHPSRGQLEASDLAVDLLGDRVDPLLQVRVVAHHVLRRQGLIGKAHVHDR